ncbi:MAG: beta-ketoacyl synthase N-terminal-like domain-containing protein, partial [Cyanobacteriota bacterium]
MKIAIVGLACNFPKSKNKDIFWDNLKNKINCISDIPKERWDINTFYSENNEEKGKMNTKRAGFIDDIELFDADFFNISSLEAENMDPQQKILLETTYSALQDSGMIIEKIKGKKGGVFIGISASDYSYISRDPEQVDIYSISGVSLSVASNRLSYFFDLKGPSLSIDTACSSSLTAIDLACKSIKNNESDFAISGGVNIILNPMITIGFSQAQGTSPDGNCSAFSDKANGMVRAEGCGIVILKTLEKAIEDNDRIYAVIEGSAINQDGKTNGLLAPSPEGQKNVLEQAYKNSGIDILNLDFIESHGTGTNLGDPIEALALGEILGKKREKNNPLKIGAVKTNIGHLEPAAGIAGLIKTALCIYNKELVPTINYINPNPYIPFNELNLKVQTECEKLEKDKIFAGVSSFGFGGTNAHVVLSNDFDNPSNSLLKAIKGESAECDANNEILIISAQTEKAVEDSLKKYSDFLENKKEIDLNDFCYSNNLRKELHKYRYSIGFNSKDDLLKKLSYFDKEKIVSKPRRKKKLAFVFSGMGSQQNSMGKELLNNPIFSNFIKECDILIKKYYDWS